MRARCLNPREAGYKNYGGRGIYICDRWHLFANFFADMGLRPAGHSIDRINNDGPYEPSNCRWVTRIVQCRNKRNNFLIEYRGQIKPLQEWAECLGINQGTLYYRIATCKWPASLAFEKPVGRWDKITFHNESLTAKQWADKLGVNPGTIRSRITKLHWPIEKALTVKSRKINLSLPN